MSDFQKQPGESVNYGVDFVKQLPPGSTLLRGSCSAVDMESGADVTATLLGSSTATIAGTVASVLHKGGTNGRVYNTQFIVTLSTGEILDGDLSLLVQESP